MLSAVKIFLGNMKMMLALPFSYERQGHVRKVVKAQQLWYAIIESQTETGTPYMLYKDSCNRKSNQQNLGTIKCSNLCTEIVEYTSKDEVGRRTSALSTEAGVLGVGDLFVNPSHAFTGVGGASIHSSPL